MRILHTSDWHLGRSFHREGMLAHQAEFVDHLLDVVASEHVDLVVMAGDFYDRALPHVDAVDLADEALARLATSRAAVALTSGNHDSARRLGFSSRLIDAAGVHVRTDPATIGTPVVLHDAHGPVHVHGIPYLEPDVARLAWNLPTRSHEAALGEAMRRIRATGRPAGTRTIVLAHAFVAGGRPSESERDISVGGVSRVPVPVFDGIDYVALGHLHGAQTLTDSVRYSGSPLAYSFSETGQVKGSWLVDLGPRGLERATFVPAPVPRSLGRIRGELETLLGDPSLRAHAASWLEVTLTDEIRPRGAMERLRRRFPHTLLLSFAAAGDGPGATPASLVSGRGDHEIATEFVRVVRGREPDAAEIALLREAIDACCEDEDADPRLVTS